MLVNKVSERDVRIARLLKQDRACRDDPVLFFNTFLYTFDPKRPPFHFPFRLFPFQEERIVNNLVHAIEMGYDIFFDKTREMGVSYTCLGTLLWYWKYRDASNFLLGSRKEDFVDNVGKRNEDENSNKEASLFGKLDYMIDRLPAIILPQGYVPKMHRTRMNLQNPENGNNMSGESSNPNFSRGGRQKAILMDEFAFWENDDAAWGSTADTTNCRIVITTPGIRPGTKAKRLRFGTDGEKIKVVELPYYLDPRKTADWLEGERERRSKEDFAREIEIDWEGSIKGIVYPEGRNRVVGDFPYNPDWPLYVTWDFGLDGTAVQWWQYNRDNGKMRIVDAIKRTDQPIHWFFPFFGHDIESAYQYEPKELDTIERVSWFQPGIHYGDPDVTKRSMTSRVMTSNKEELRKKDILVQTNRKANTFYERREQTKRLFKRGIEVNATPTVVEEQGWLESIDNARYPKREETSQATTAINLPIHDWTSHHRTATEYLAVNFKLPNPNTGAGVVNTAPPSQQARQSVVLVPGGYMSGGQVNIGKALHEAANDY